LLSSENLGLGFCAPSVQVMAELRNGEWVVRGPAPAPQATVLCKTCSWRLKATEFSFTSGFLTFGLNPLLIEGLAEKKLIIFKLK
jgi:hypothetical protein